MTLEVEQRLGYREIKAQHESAYDAVLGAQSEVMEAKPVTPAGAITLLRFVAELIAFLGDDEQFNLDELGFALQADGAIVLTKYAAEKAEDDGGPHRNDPFWSWPLKNRMK